MPVWPLVNVSSSPLSHLSDDGPASPTPLSCLVNGPVSRSPIPSGENKGETDGMDEALLEGELEGVVVEELEALLEAELEGVVEAEREAEGAS